MSGNASTLEYSGVQGTSIPSNSSFEQLFEQARQLASKFGVPQETTTTSYELLDRLSAFDRQTAKESLQTLPLAIEVGQVVGEYRSGCVDYASLWSAALLHDIGKVAVPKNIIDKSNIGAEWTDHDRELMRVHPLAGAMILRAYNFSEYIARPVEEHHHKQLGNNNYGKNPALNWSERVIRDCVAAADFADAALHRENTRNSHMSRHEREQEISADIQLLFNDYEHSKVLIENIIDRVLRVA